MSRVKIPNMSDIQVQLAYVSSEGVLENVKKQKRCLYLRPPINSYATLDFFKFDEIRQVGYEYAQKEIKEWKKQRGYTSMHESNEDNIIRRHKRSSSTS